MNILHVTPHMGGGVGSVIMGWMDRVIAANDHGHRVICLDYANEKAKNWAYREGFPMEGNMGRYPRLWEHEIENADIVLCHYWDHPMIADIFAEPIPECRLVFWCHKNISYSPEQIAFPDRWIDTSRIQGHGEYIWSTRGIDRFLEIKPKPHKGFNIGYVGTVDYKKMHPHWLLICEQIKEVIPEARFTVVGENKIGAVRDDYITFSGHVDDVAPYLAEMDVFFYPLRENHFGTSEQVLGESMAAGVVPVVMKNPCEIQIVSHGEDGLVAKDETDAVSCVDFLFWNPLQRKWMADNARISAADKYDINKMSYQWNSIFEDIMNSPKKQKGVL